MPGKTSRPCAECRRLKHKCDKRVPCSGCVKRGCQSICPEGTNQTGEGHRRFWARTLELRTNLESLAQRVRDLEDALRAAHALNASERHPLLEDELLKVKDPYLQDVQYSDSGSDSPPTSETPSLASSSVSPERVIKGASLRVHRLVKHEGSRAPSPLTTVTLHDLPHELRLAPCDTLSLLAKPAGVDHQDLLATLRCYLPQPEDTLRLWYLYRTCCTVAMDYLEEGEHDQVFHAVHHFSLPADHAQCLRALQLHAIAFLTYANAALFDSASSTTTASHFYELGCAALSSTEVIKDPTMEGIQALCLMALYQCHLRQYKTADAHGNIEWSLVGIIAKAAFSIGLHRDPEHSACTPHEVHRRRHLFWNIYVHDVSLGIERALPRSLAIELADVRFPERLTTAHDIVNRWKYEWHRDSVEPVLRTILFPTSVSPQKLLDLDHRLRSLELPSLLQFGVAVPEEFAAQSAWIAFQRIVTAMMTQCTFLLLHRASFNLALRMHASDPMSSPFSHSVSVSYQSAFAILSMACQSHDSLGTPVIRHGCLYDIVLVAAKTLALFITRCPTLSTIPDALKQLEHANNAAQSLTTQGAASGPLQKAMAELTSIARSNYLTHVFGQQSGGGYGAGVVRPQAEVSMQELPSIDTRTSWPDPHQVSTIMSQLV